eukprot:1161233-Pelagomonas_calceolata.AAC.14
MSQAAHEGPQQKICVPLALQVCMSMADGQGLWASSNSCSISRPTCGCRWGQFVAGGVNKAVGSSGSCTASRPAYRCRRMQWLKEIKAWASRKAHAGLAGLPVAVGKGNLLQGACTGRLEELRLWAFLEDHAGLPGLRVTPRGRGLTDFVSTGGKHGREACDEREREKKDHKEEKKRNTCREGCDAKDLGPISWRGVDCLDAHGHEGEVALCSK